MGGGDLTLCALLGPLLHYMCNNLFDIVETALQKLCGFFVDQFLVSNPACFFHSCLKKGIQQELGSVTFQFFLDIMTGS